MRRRRRGLEELKEPEFMIIPMIDIIFFLLVFFMMSTLHMVQQNVIAVQLPQSAHSQHEPKKNINVTVTAAGAILVDQEEMPLQLLRRRIEMEVERSTETVFILRGDKEVTYQAVILALDEMKGAGAKNIAIATEKKTRD